MEILSLDDIQKLEAKNLREILKSNSKCLPVILYPWIFCTQMICTQAQVFRTHFDQFIPNPLVNSYPTNYDTKCWKQSQTFILFILEITRKLIYKITGTLKNYLLVNTQLRIYESHIFELRIKTWMKVIHSVMCTTRAVVKIRPEKIQACMGFEHMHRYCRGHGLKSCTGLNFFKALFSLLLK